MCQADHNSDTRICKGLFFRSSNGSGTLKPASFFREGSDLCKKCEYFQEQKRLRQRAMEDKTESRSELRTARDEEQGL
jgi:hypothetical protein